MENDTAKSANIVGAVDKYFPSVSPAPSLSSSASTSSIKSTDSTVKHDAKINPQPYPGVVGR